MTIVLLANHPAILPAIEYFSSKGVLKAVVSAEIRHAENSPIEGIALQYGIPFYRITRNELTTTALELFNKIKPDLVLMCGFTYRIPACLFSIPPLGFFNIHFSVLPAYRGADPVFWQIKNGEQTGGITIHRVDEDFDSGEIVLQQSIPFIPGETWGICNSRYTTILFNMLLQLTASLDKEEPLLPIAIDINNSTYYPHPDAADLTIQWDLQTTAQIENLVNASNPNAGGAITYLNHQLVRILEVSPVDGKGECYVPTGTIIHADTSGLYVQCLESNLLRINILKLSEGFITGFKLAALGVKKGDRFESDVLQHRVLSN